MNAITSIPNMNELNNNPSVLKSRPMMILFFIWEYKGEHDYSPKIREVCEGANITSTSVVTYYLKILKSYGLLDWIKYEARTLHLTKKGKELVQNHLLPMDNRTGNKSEINRQADIIEL